MSELDEPTVLNIDMDDDRVLEVQGIPLGTSRQMVELFFESAKQSGGGVIENLNYDSDGHALITFENRQGSSSPHQETNDCL